VVGACWLKAIQRSAGAVRLYAFTFVSNHFHLVVWARGAALASFMQYRRANLSRKVGKEGWFAEEWAEPVELEVAPRGPCTRQACPPRGVVQAQHPHTQLEIFTMSVCFLPP
jgi:hypothetical protein